MTIVSGVFFSNSLILISPVAAINRSNYAADSAKTSGHDFLRIETKRIFRAIAKRA